MARRLPSVVVEVTVEFEVTKNPLYTDGFLALENLRGFGLVHRVDALGRLLTQPADQIVGRLENDCTHPYLQLGDRVALRRFGLKTGDQLLDLPFLGKKDRRRERVF